MKRLGPLALLLLVLASFAACKRVIDLFPDGGVPDGTPIDTPSDTPFWYDDGGLGGPFVDAGTDAASGPG